MPLRTGRGSRSRTSATLAQPVALGRAALAGPTPQVSSSFTRGIQCARAAALERSQTPSTSDIFFAMWLGGLLSRAEAHHPIFFLLHCPTRMLVIELLFDGSVLGIERAYGSLARQEIPAGIVGSRVDHAKTDRRRRRTLGAVVDATRWTEHRYQGLI
jgi:hypothetical protein